MQSKTPKATVKTIISEIPKSPSKNWGEELPEEVHQQLQENKEEPTHPEYVNHFPSLGDTPPDKKTAYLSPPNKKGSDFIREILSPSNANQKETQAQGFGDKVQQYMDSFGEKDPNESKSQSPRSLKSVASTSVATKEEDHPNPQQRESDDQKETQNEANPTPLFEEKTSDEKCEVNNKEISFEQVESHDKKSPEVKESKSEQIDEPNPSNTENNEESEYLAFPVDSHPSEPIVTIEEKEEEETSTEKIPAISVTTNEETTHILESKEIEKPSENEFQGKEELERQEEKEDQHQKKKREIEICLQKGLQYKRDNLFNFAILEFKKLLDLVKDTDIRQLGVSDEEILSYQTELVSCLFLIGDFQECAQVSRSILEKHPQSQRVLYYLGTSLMRQQLPEEGITYLKEAKSAQLQDEEYSDRIEKEIKEFEDKRKPTQVEIEEPKLAKSEEPMPKKEEPKVAEVEESEEVQMEAPTMEVVTKTEQSVNPVKEEKKPETPKENLSKPSSSIGLGTILGSAIGSGIFGFGIAKFVFGASEKKGAIAGLAISIITGGVSLLFQK